MRTFILRLQEDTARDGGPGSLRGLVDEVATGRQVTFRSDRELVAALLAAMAPVQRVTPRGRADSAHGGSSPGNPHPDHEES